MGEEHPAILKYLDAMRARGASDLHFKPGAPPILRIHGELVPMDGERLDEETIRALVFELSGERHRRQYEETGNLDFAWGTSDARFRINLFRQRGRTSVAIRLVHKLIKSFEELHLPDVVRQVAEMSQGLVIVAGPTGCGKSTTLAAIIEHINLRRPCHIVTIEDPIEYLYEDRKALISQREIGIDVEDFDTAMKYVVRADPDVVLIGEMRDRETFESGLSAAETGHLVFGTLHTSSVAQTFDRIVSFFPQDRHRMIRNALAFNLQAIVCQMLLPAATETDDRIPAVEVMLSSPVTRKIILDEEDSRLPDAVRVGREDGMQDFTESLRRLVQEGLVDRRVAMEHAPNREALKMALKGIVGGETGIFT